MHEIEAHLIEFIQDFGCVWVYSEEGIESSHHWLKLFREITCSAVGWRNKYLKLAEYWEENHSKSGMDEVAEIMCKGGKRRFAPRPNREKANLADLVVQF